MQLIESIFKILIPVKANLKETASKNTKVEMEDRRIFIRLKAKFPLSFLCSDRKIEGKAQTLDISANGIGIITDEKLPPNTPLEIWLQIPDNHQPLYLKGEVVWSQAVSEAEKQRVGIRLEKENLMGFARAYRIQ